MPTRSLTLLTSFFNWLWDDGYTYPANWAQLHPDEKSQVEATIERLRTQVSSSRQDISSVLDGYEYSYQKFLEAGLPQDFKRFLSTADRKISNSPPILAHNCMA